MDLLLSFCKNLGPNVPYFGFTDACKKDQLETAKFWYATGRIDVSQLQQILLEVACRFGHFSIAQFLLNDVGMDPAVNEFWFASTNGYEVVKLLLANGQYEVVKRSVWLRQPLPQQP
jgi:hypothetical protein